MGLEQTATLASQITVRTAAVSGRIHGGPNPIQQANVTLWETWTYGISGVATGRTALASNSGYGSKAYAIGSATTNSLGLWQVGSFNCDPGEYVYVTATGGKTASNSANNNEVLLAPIGACSALPAAVHTDVSELSTLAVAYTLGSFLSEDTGYLAGGQQRVFIGAPAANNASAASCTGTGAAMTCVACGLGDAFDAALSLVPSTNYVTTAQTALSANTVPTDPSGNIPNATGAIPAALLNTLANALQGCVNSSGGTPPDTSACGLLFAATTVGSSVPSDTLQASVSIAKHPTNSVGSIYALALPVSAFAPALTAVPTDFSLAVTYTGSDATHASSFGCPLSVVFGPDGKVFVGLELYQNYSCTGGLAALDPNGQQWAFSSLVTVGLPIAADAAGHVYAFSGTSSPAGLVRLSTADLSLQSAISYSNVGTTASLSVDRNNNLYVPTSTAAIPILSLGPADTALSRVNTTSASPVQLDGGATGTEFLALDSSQNLWASHSQDANKYLGTKLSSGSGCTPPLFCTATTITPAADATQYGAIAFTSDGTAWFGGQSKIYQVSSAGVYLGSFNAPASQNGEVEGLAVDGVNNLFTYSFQALLEFSTTTQTWTKLQPCTLVVAQSSTQSTTCSPALYSGLFPTVDAAGTVWVPDYFGNKVTKVFGVAAPAWPYAGYSHPGVMPQ